MNDEQNPKNRVMVIGLDGATLDLIEPWAAAGLLPNLARLMSEGGYSRLSSVQPVVSAAAWSTFMTGMNPGTHGVYDFVYRDAESYQLRPVMRHHIDSPSLWQLLSQQGKRVCVLNVPITYPPEEVNGIMVSGLGTPEFTTFTHPPEIGDELLQNGYQINRKVYDHRDHEDEFLEDTYRITDGVTNAALTLMAREPWDFFMVVYRDTDELSHGFWHHMDESHPEHDPTMAEKYGSAIQDYYRYLDAECGKLLDAAGPNVTLFIVSDHGFGPFYKDVYLNEWLRQKGYLVNKGLSTQRALTTRLGLTRSNISKILRSTGLGKVERLIKDILGNRIEILPRTAWTDFSDGIDWSQTRAYSYGYQGQIYINLIGREPEGIVSADSESGSEADMLLDALIRDLQTLVDPDDGLPVADEIRRGSELYHGSHAEAAPDLVITMRNYGYMTRLGHELDNKPGEIFSPSRWQESGGHQIDGVLIAAGPGVKSQAQAMSTCWLGDIAPTVLAILGASSAAQAMDGRFLAEWLHEEFASISIQGDQASGGISDGKAKEQSLSAEEEKEIMERLRALGYL